MKDCGLPILSVDIPSGWHVEDGPQVRYPGFLWRLRSYSERVSDPDQPLYTQDDEQSHHETIETFTPKALISLTVPKLGVRSFKGQHWLGGRFVPESVILLSTHQHRARLTYCSEVEKKFELNIPEYPGTEGVVELPPYKE